MKARLADTGYANQDETDGVTEVVSGTHLARLNLRPNEPNRTRLSWRPFDPVQGRFTLQFSSVSQFITVERLCTAL